ncbi:polysaccharide deacetylase family protein [Streptomyces sp. NPDC101393]|uniref:polysaccharide deacetylase family protein n=1 Tax=Streptomyces sp. NPDC101393 TaxID=3366141 RepID=UPI00382AA55F
MPDEPAPAVTTTAPTPAPGSASDPVPVSRRTRRVFGAPPWVLMYHSVAEIADASEDPYQVTVSPDRLDRQLRWLRKRGLRGVAVGELLRARAAGQGRGLVGLTFDDGYADFRSEALPLLLRHECTATVFVLPGRPGGENAWDPLGPRKPLLTEGGIRAVGEAGMEIGSHGLVHTDLTTADDETLAQETAGSRALLAELTGRAPDGFCYPYGTVDARSAAAVRAAGYGYACAIDPGPLTALHALPRAHIGAADTAWRLHLKRALHPLRRRPLPRERTEATPATTTGGIR